MPNYKHTRMDVCMYVHHLMFRRCCRPLTQRTAFCIREWLNGAGFQCLRSHQDTVSGAAAADPNAQPSETAAVNATHVTHVGCGCAAAF